MYSVEIRITRDNRTLESRDIHGLEFEDALLILYKLNEGLKKAENERISAAMLGHKR